MNSMKKLSDEDVWACFCKGDSAAFEEVYCRYHPVLSSYGMRMTGDPEFVADVIQNLFVKLIRNCRNLRRTDNLKYYLLTAFRNRVFDEYRKGNQSVPLEENDRFFVYDKMPDSSFEADDEEMRVTASLEKALEHLSKRQREILYLYYVKGLTHAQIANMLGINRQSSKNLLFRALMHLRNMVYLCVTQLIFSGLMSYFYYFFKK